MKRHVYDDEHELFRETVRQFVQRDMRPHVEDWERAGIVDRSLYDKAGAAGLMGFYVPQEYGGGGTDDFRYEAILCEEIGSSGALGSGQGIVNHQVFVSYLVRLANAEQRARWLPGVADGRLLGTVAMTEPGTGSDLSAISTKAVRDRDDYVLTGSKIFISSGMSSDLVIVVCRTGTSDRSHHNLSLMVVEGGTKGFTRGRNLEKIGQHAADTAELFFDEARVPVANLLGEEHRGFEYLVSNLPSERLNVAIVAVAHAQAAFDWTLAYTKERVAFGQPIASFQNSRFALATMRTELDIAQVFLDQQIYAFGRGELTAEDAAEAKWWCTDLNKRVLDQCLQLHGGYGYMEEYPIARAWRDGRAMCIYAGTNEIMKDLIGRRRLGV